MPAAGPKYIHGILPQHLLSRIGGWVSTRRYVWFRDWVIGWFIKRYQVDMTEAELPTAQDYPHFNAFFTRALKDGVRPIGADIVSPADGTCAQVGSIDQGRLIQAKGVDFTVRDLLAGQPFAAEYQQGQFMTIYLAPRDYHRVHMPFAGKLQQMVYVPGKLFSVNTDSAATVPNLFARNERVIALFETVNGPMVVILVGAMLVAGIQMVWHGLVAPSATRQVTTWDYQEKPIAFEKGDEIGRFQFGSTVILLFPEQVMSWQADIAAEKALHYGQTIGTMCERNQPSDG